MKNIFSKKSDDSKKEKVNEQSETSLNDIILNFVYKNEKDKSITEVLYNENDHFVPWIFCDTEFKKPKPPHHYFASHNNIRRLQLPTIIIHLPLKQHIDFVSNFVKNHYKIIHEIIAWGKIERYIYYMSPEKKLVFSTDGILLEEIKRKPLIKLPIEHILKAKLYLAEIRQNKEIIKSCIIDDKESDIINNQTYGLLYYFEYFDKLTINFLTRCAEVLKLNMKEIEEHKNGVLEILKYEINDYKPWIFCNTYRYWAGSSIICFAATDRFRRITLPKVIKLFPREYQINITRKIVIEHNIQKNGKIHLWGKIRDYDVYFSPTSGITFLPNGEIFKNWLGR